MHDDNFGKRFGKSLTVIEKSLERSLQADTTAIAKPFVDQMAYALLGGGKRIRALMMFETAQMLKRTTHPEAVLSDIEPAVVAVEYVQAYSLVHDDLPSMDNDTQRRGKPCTHIK